MSLAVGKRIVAGAIGITNQQDISDHSKAISANQNNPEIKGSLRYGIRELNKYVDNLNKMTIKNVDPVRVGTWIDGKPLYEQVFVISNINSSGSAISMRHGISNVDFIEIDKTTIITPKGAAVNLPYRGDASNTYTAVTVDSLIYSNSAGHWAGGTLYITIRFTSTTDVPDTDMTLEELENEEY